MGPFKDGLGDSSLWMSNLYEYRLPGRRGNRDAHVMEGFPLNHELLMAVGLQTAMDSMSVTKSGCAERLPHKWHKEH